VEADEGSTSWEKSAGVFCADQGILSHGGIEENRGELSNLKHGVNIILPPKEKKLGDERGEGKRTGNVPEQGDVFSLVRFKIPKETNLSE